MKSFYLDIAVPVPLRRSFHYCAPKGYTTAELIPGSRIWVPFGKQTLVGIITRTNIEPNLPVHKLKSASSLIDQTPVFNQTLYRICTWAADYYQHPIGEVFHTALPQLLRQGAAATASTRKLFACQDKINLSDLKRAPRQKQLLQRLLKSPTGLSQQSLQATQIDSHIIRALSKRGAAEWRQVDQDSIPLQPQHIVTGEHQILTNEQALALNSVSRPGTHLLFGVTGSGKTEVYLQAIARAVKQNRQALVLIPEIGLTPQTFQRFQQRFNTHVYTLHSGLTPQARLRGWQLARTGAATIIIGTRSAIFTPMRRLGLIVVDEEHDGSFKQQEGFRYSARDLAVLRGQLEGIPVILGSATPSAETYHNATTGKYTLTKLERRANRAELPTYKTINIQHHTLVGGISEPLRQLIKEHLADQHQVLVFHNRRGFAPVVFCQHCHWIAECHRCDARLTFHASSHNLICHHCTSQRPLPKHCPNCQGKQLIPLGLGTQRVEQCLRQLFPKQTIIRIDRDSTRRKTAMTEIMQQIATTDSALLLGTQMIAKGHHFPRVTLVSILDIDGGFYSADFRAIEHMAQLLLQVSGRAGREQKPGIVAIQTHLIEQPILKLLLNDGYETFIKSLLQERLQYDLPPSSFQALILAEARAPKIAKQFLLNLAQAVPSGNLVKILGPLPAIMEKRAGKHRAQLLVTSKHRQHLHTTLQQCVRYAEANTHRKIKWSVDMDPYNLF